MQNKQLSSLERPQVLTVVFSYTTQRTKFGGDGAGAKALQFIYRDWTIGGVLRYQSGQLLETPSANNNFLYQLGVGSQDNPAVFSSPQGVENYVPGQPFFLVNPNSHFDPTKTLVLNPNAWTEPAPGTFGVSAPYYWNNRWQRQPAESLSLMPNLPDQRRSIRYKSAVSSRTYSIACSTPLLQPEMAPVRLMRQPSPTRSRLRDQPRGLCREASGMSTPSTDSAPRRAPDR